MGLNPLPCPVNVSIAVWPWGAYLGDEGVAHGVRMKISSWQRHDPNSMPPAAKGTGMYINSSMAKVEALKAGYDEAILLSPQGYVSECTGENIFVVKGGRIITPPVSAGALEGITQSSVMTIARDLGFEVEVGNILRSDLYTADEAFLSGTAAEVVPIRSVDDRLVGSRRPGTDHPAHPGDLPRRRAGPGRPVQGLGTSMSGEAGVRRLPASVDIFDTTLRDGSQQEGLSLTVEDKLRIAEQLDHLGVQFIEGGWPGANPKDDEFFARAAAGELDLHTSTLVAFGSTRKAGGHAETDPTLARLNGAGTDVVCLVAKSAEYHVTETLRTSLDEAVHMVEDSVAWLRDQGTPGLPRRRALLRRLPPNPPSVAGRAAGRRRGRRRGPRAVRHQRRHPALRGGGHRRRRR